LFKLSFLRDNLIGCKLNHPTKPLQRAKYGGYLAIVEILSGQMSVAGSPFEGGKGDELWFLPDKRSIKQKNHSKKISLNNLIMFTVRLLIIQSSRD